MIAGPKNRIASTNHANFLDDRLLLCILYTLAFDFTKIWGLMQKYILAFDRNLTADRNLFL